MEQFDIDEAQLRKLLAEGPPLASGLSNEEVVETAMAVVNGELQLKDVKGLTDEEMEAAYANGYNIFQAGNYRKAEVIFEFLVTFDNQTKKYWTALGACRFNMKNHFGAMAAYSTAALIDVEDPGLLMKIAQCRLALGEKEVAAGALEAALEVAGEKPQHAEAKVKAEAMLKLLQGKD